MPPNERMFVFCLDTYVNAYICKRCNVVVFLLPARHVSGCQKQEVKLQHL